MSFSLTSKHCLSTPTRVVHRRKCGGICDPGTVPLHNYLTIGTRDYVLVDITDEFYCNACDSRMFTLSDLKQHYQSAGHVKRLYPSTTGFACPICPARVTSLLALAEHTKSHSSHTSICDPCNRSFSSFEALDAHNASLSHKAKSRVFGTNVHQSHVVTQGAGTGADDPKVHSDDELY